MKKFIALVLCLSVLFSLCGCSLTKDIVDSTVNTKAVEKEFEHEDFKITLTSDFLTMDFVNEKCDFIWGTEDVTVLGILAELESDVLKNITAADYAKVYCNEVENIDASQLKTLDDIPIVEYEAENDGKTFKYLVSFYKSSKGVWVVMFSAEPDYYSANYDVICKYAKSVRCDT